jgi:hypothetical protein
VIGSRPDKILKQNDEMTLSEGHTKKMKPKAPCEDRETPVQDHKKASLDCVKVISCIKVHYRAGQCWP